MCLSPVQMNIKHELQINDQNSSEYIKIAVWGHNSLVFFPETKQRLGFTNWIMLVLTIKHLFAETNDLELNNATH